MTSSNREANAEGVFRIGLRYPLWPAGGLQILPHEGPLLAPAVVRHHHVLLELLSHLQVLP